MASEGNDVTKTALMHAHNSRKLALLIVLLMIVVLYSPIEAFQKSLAKESIAPVTANTTTVAAVAIRAGSYHTCVIVQTGGVKCWGSNNTGQLGDGTTTDRSAPVDVVGLTSGVIALDTGNGFSCAVISNGSIKCWGINDDGQLGNGSRTISLTPVDVNGLNAPAIAVAANAFSACALLNTGGVQCWGSDFLGNGTDSASLTPVNVSGLSSGVSRISAGFGHTCVVMVSGGVKCWGWNLDGQVGDSTTTRKLAPVDVVGLTTGVKDITASGQYYTRYGRSGHTCALTLSGGVKCWGWNEAGQLGDGTVRSRYTPVNTIGLSSGVDAISARNERTCALLTNDTVRCWGLGVTSPRTVAGLPSDITAIAAGSDHACVLRENGGVKCWGSNWSGQLGDGTTAERTGPVDVVGLGIDRYRVTGRITDRNGRGLAGVQITAGSNVVTTDFSGNYTLNDLPSGQLTIVPKKTDSDAVFTPASISINLQSNNTGQNFIAACEKSPTTGLDSCALLPGDLLLIRGASTGFLGIDTIWAIERGSYFHHVGMYTGNQEVTEAVGPQAPSAEQVITHPIEQTSWWSSDPVLDWAVIRPKSPPNKQLAVERVKEWAAASDPIIGYAFSLRTDDTSFYCSKLVWRAYQLLGYNIEQSIWSIWGLTLDPLVTPGDLYNDRSTLIQENFNRIDNISIPATIAIGPQPPVVATDSALHSPSQSSTTANIMLIDPQGRRTGYDPSTGNLLNEIPEAIYSGEDAQVQNVSVTSLGPGWSVQVTGINGGDFRVVALFLRNATYQQQLIEGTVSPGETKTFTINPPSTLYLPLLRR
jgi:alpha-tubulin suppressor-like RCC1 family protein